MKVSDLDRRITIQSSSVTQDSTYGTDVASWPTLATVWANVQDMLPSRGEKFADGISIARRPSRIRIRYRSDVTSDMRVVIGSRTLRIITMPAEIGRREWLEFIAEEVTTGGQEP